MSKKFPLITNIDNYIEPLTIGGMSGRMLCMPVKNKRFTREILFIYGQHASLERFAGLAEYLNNFGAVTIPDLPGLGGMSSFYSIGSKPDLDNFADYLASFIKLRFNRKRFVLAGLSFGFAIVTRMLQKYPELTNRIDLLVSVVGFAHHEDFRFSPGRFRFYSIGSTFFTWRLPAFIVQKFFLQTVWIDLVYSHLYNSKNKFEGKTGSELKLIKAVEANLWQTNDVRTQFYCNTWMFKLNNCTSRIDLPLYHVYAEKDLFFDKERVEQHLRVIFEDFTQVKSQLDTHSVSVVSNPKEASRMIPPKLRKILREKQA